MRVISLEVAERLAAIADMVRVVSVRQKQPLGLGHAVLCARSVVGDEPFAVLLGDDLVDCDHTPGIGQLIGVYEETGCGVVATLEVPHGQQHLYGIVAGTHDDAGRIRVARIVEKPNVEAAPSRHAVIGRYVLPPEIWDILENMRPGVGGEIQLTDALGVLAEHSRLIGVPIVGQRYDAGDSPRFLGGEFVLRCQAAGIASGCDGPSATGFGGRRSIVTEA